ncbi:MAG: hypothetical protein SNJ72_03680 [Fimbriimonadales bacterium]
MRTILTILGCVVLMTAIVAQAKPPTDVQRKLAAIRDLTEFRLVQLADEYWHDGQHYKVMSLLQVLIEYAPQEVEHYSTLAWLYSSYGDFPRARQTYERGIRAVPNQWDLYYDYGFWLFQRGELERARTYLERAVSFPNVPGFAWKTLAHTCERLGDYKRSIEAWENAKKVDPTDGAVEPNMARVRKKLQEQQQNNS